MYRSAIIGVTIFGVGCNPRDSAPGVYAKITREVTTWIKSVASGTQDSDCDTEDHHGKEERKQKNIENDLVNLIEKV